MSKYDQHAEKIVNAEHVGQIHIEHAHIERTRKPRKKIPKKTVRLCISFLLFLAVLASILAAIFVPKSKQKNNQDVVHSLFQSSYMHGNCLEALEGFHNLAARAKDKESFLLFSCYEAYFNEVCAEQFPEDAEKYTNNALKIARSVKESAEYMSWYYYFATAIEATSYHGLGFSTDDENWKDAIYALIGHVETQEPNLEDDNELMLYLLSYQAIDEYYNNIDLGKLPSMMDPYFGEQIARYRNSLYELNQYVAESSGTVYEMDTKIMLDYYVAKICSSFYPLAYSNPESLDEINFIIDECKSAIRKLNYSEKTQDLFLTYYQVLALAEHVRYVYYEFLEEFDGMDDIKQEIYNDISPMLRLPNQNTDQALSKTLFTTHLLFHICNFTEDDARRYYDSVKKYLEFPYSGSSFLDDRMEFETMVCSVFQEVTTKFGYNKEYFDLCLGFQSHLEDYLAIHPDTAKKDEIERSISFFRDFPVPERSLDNGE